MVQVGSGKGQYVSTVAMALLKVEGPFPLTPALYFGRYDKPDLTLLAKRTRIVHGWGDAVVNVREQFSVHQAAPMRSAFTGWRTGHE